MKGSVSYGLARVCRVWGVARSAIYWQPRESRDTGRHPGPLGPCTDEELVSQIWFLGLTSSPAFVRELQGNRCAERLIRTIKENLLWLTTSAAVEALRLALPDFSDGGVQTPVVRYMGEERVT